jgi:hypothetical protein
MIDIIGTLSEDREYMNKFCQDCPAISRIPATLRNPAEEGCPADFEPFYNTECCVRRNDVAAIFAAAQKIEEVA